MAKVPASFAVDYGQKLSDRFHDIRWLSKSNEPPLRRWFTLGEQLPDGHGDVFGFGTVDDDDRLVVNCTLPGFFDSADSIPLWFVLVDRRGMQPSHFVLLAYADDSYPMGTVFEAHEASKLFDDQYLSNWAALINWREGDPMLQQITVAPAWRRRRLATKMTCICDIVNACYGFSPGRVLHGGAVTTEDGEKLRNVFSGASDRIDPRSGSVSPLIGPQDQ